MSDVPFHVVIPARYGSSRLPGKPLLEIDGKPMVRHVCEQAVESGAGHVVVATDDPRIVEAVEAFIEPDNLGLVTGVGFDYVIDCIDNFRIKAALIAGCRRAKMRLITVGGAGGQTDPTRIRLADLSRTEQDPLLAKTRKLLRQDYGFPRNPKRRFEVPCVYSLEQQRHPQSCDTDDHGHAGGLNCGGFGSAMPVTASFGLVAVSHVLKKLAAG